MILEERKDNTYFDQSGKQILEGDLLKVFHFRSGNRNYYMYQVVVMEDSGESLNSKTDFHVMSLKSYYAEKPHYRLYSVVNSQRIYLSAKIISSKGIETKRKKIKITL